MENLQSNTDVAVNSNHMNFRQKQTNDRLFLTSKNIYYVFVTATALNLRSGPGLNNSVLRILPMGTHMFSLSSKNSEWLRVFTPHNFKGWVARKHVIFYQPKSLGTINSNISYLNFRSLLEAGISNYMKEIYEQKKLNINDKLSIIVEDLAKQKILASIHSNKRIKSASTIKVPILHAYMIQSTEGELIVNPNHKKMIENMIRFSNNPDTNTVIKLLGGPAKTQRILEQTKIYKKIHLIEYIPENGRTYGNTITVSDLNNIFKKLWILRVLGEKYSIAQNKKASIEMLNLLKLPGYTWRKDRIKAGTCYSTNKAVTLWDKTGFVKGSNGNAGIVEINTPFGRKAYSIVIFIERNDFHSIKLNVKKWFEKTSMHMRRISEMTYAFFSNQYHNYNDCGLPLLIRYTSKDFLKHY